MDRFTPSKPHQVSPTFLAMCTHCSVPRPGTTHLLIASSSTPNAVPSFLANMIPQICETLLALDVSANFLGALSPALAMCHSLEELNIASNPLRALPSFLSNLTSLRVLIADATGIHTLPDSLTSLEKLHTLSIRRNKMHSLPGWLCLLSSLETLLVDGNPFQGPWKALVEPLLTKVIPNSPLYPPSTPGFPSTAGSTASADTDTDTEDLEQSPNPGPNSVPPEDEDHTMTPARAQLERATTSPYPLDSAPPRGSSGGLTRNRTTPNRAYYEKGRSPQNSPNLDNPRSAASDNVYSGEREVRRMKSATELRETKSQGPSPSRPTFTHYATSLSSSNLLMTNPQRTIPQSPPLETKVPPKRFASLGVTGSPTRISANRSRPLLSNTGWDTVLEEGQPAGPSSSTSSTFSVSSNPPTPPQRKSLIKVRPPSSPGDEFDRRLRKEDKDRSSRWGFLKKMSMGKIKPDISPRQERPHLPSHGSQTQSFRQSQASRAPERGPPSINVLIPTTSMLDSPPRNFTAPKILERKASSDVLANFPVESLKRTQSTDALNGLPPIHSNANPLPTASLVPPPTGPTPRASKRRSFLPIDLALRESNISPATNSAFSEEDPSDSRTTPSPKPSTAEVAESFRRREEERAREFYTRALRSVMAYLRDMHDLSQSQLSVLSVYGSSTPDLNSSRSRRPTIVEANRGISEPSISTEPHSQLRSEDSRGSLRNGTDQATSSTVTVDSTGSVEEKERQVKADKGKRLRIVREIVECVSSSSPTPCADSVIQGPRERMSKVFRSWSTSTSNQHVPL